ncbi:hypothetical protein [Halalkalibacter akibai]|uniref:Uncharacterized protein n=1 Tax=Halalkalibacter akibai (strain ATCC 43226 / DSM 21942 / CIP 109018 / JCM 9157 / 1139) TaxID=1236973 RepID=W4QZ48_HALA3|nr:hypothetical protein [Halalkalibacter akibai]GAE37187.1 hypothetical protein JCM9157_4455 [Halalkalibacter akibai JCM 9157]
MDKDEGRYTEILNEVKSKGFSQKEIAQIEELVKIAKRSNLPLKMPSEAKTKTDYMISLAGAYAMLKSFKALGDQGYIVYQNDEGDMVHHFANGRIEKHK